MLHKFSVLILFLQLFISNSYAEAEQKSKPTLLAPEPGDTLVIEDLVFSNFLSPNGDGKNDTYIILNIENYPANYLKIYNRWGDLVYEAEPYINDWDGTNNTGKSFLKSELPTGAYFFEFSTGTGLRGSGKILLKR